MQLSYYFLPDILNVNQLKQYRKQNIKNTEFKIFKLLNRSLLKKSIFSCSAKYKRFRLYRLLDIKTPSNASFKEKIIKTDSKRRKKKGTALTYLHHLLLMELIFR